MPKPNPFTPKSGGEPKIFAGRKDDREITFLTAEIAKNAEHFLSAHL